MSFVVNGGDLKAANPSDATSEPFWIGDGTRGSFQIRGGTSASTTTVQFSNINARTTVLAEEHWSTDTVIIGQGLFPFDPSARWLRCISDATIFDLHIKNGDY